MNALEVLALVSKNRPRPFEQLTHETLVHAVIPAAWDAIPGYVAGTVLRTDSEFPYLETYVARASGGSALVPLARYTCDTDLESLRTPLAGSVAVVMARHESRLEDRSWIGVVHLRVGREVQALSAGSRRVSVGTAGLASVLWHDEPPSLEVTTLAGRVSAATDGLQSDAR